MTLFTLLVVTALSGLYTSLWGAFKDCPYEGLKLGTFPRSIYFNVVILLALYAVPAFRSNLLELSLFQVFFLTMGAERFLAELYKGFFRTEDQVKYFVPSRITVATEEVLATPVRAVTFTAKNLLVVVM